MTKPALLAKRSTNGGEAKLKHKGPIGAVKSENQIQLKDDSSIMRFKKRQTENSTFELWCYNKDNSE